VSGEDRQAALQVFAMARGALRRLAAAHQGFELVIAFLAGVFE
jgi:hypothetical protein